MNTKPRYWFPAKTYGWGWGLPSTWQGWLVFTLFHVLLFGAIPLIHPGRHVLGFILYVAGLSAVLLVICWRTGEPTHWRWGKK